MAPGGRTLRSVWGRTISDMWAVGDGGTIIHSAGGTWKAQISGGTHNLHAVTGSSTGPVWSVGAKGTVLRYAGAVSACP